MIAKIAAVVFIALILIMLIMLPVWFLLLSRVLNYLKEKHSEIWSSLGSPGLIKNNTVSSNLLLMGFLGKKEYEKVGDVELENKYSVLRRFFGVYMIVFLLTVAAFILFSMRNSVAS